MKFSNELASTQFNTHSEFPELAFMDPARGYWGDVQTFRSDLSTAKRVTIRIGKNFDKSGKHTRNAREALEGIEDEDTDTEEQQSVGELTADDYACVAPFPGAAICFALRSLPRRLCLCLSCRKVKDRFCSGPGQSTNLAHFYVFLALHRVNLSNYNVAISGGVSGDGSAYGKSDGDGNKRPKKKVAQAQVMATAVGHAFKAAGLGASSQTKDGELAEEEKLVKLKEAAALDEQAKATKAGAMKQFVECEAIPEELRLQAISQWAVLLGCSVAEPAPAGAPP